MSRLSEYVASRGRQGRRLDSAIRVVLAAFFLALLGYLAWLAAPNLLPKSAEARYVADQESIELAVLGHRSGYPGKPLSGGGYGRRSLRSASMGSEEGRGWFFGLNPTFAQYRRGTRDALRLEDVPEAEITSLRGFATNPAGGARGGTPSWDDVDGDGVRTPGAEKLYFDGASPALDHWNTTTVIEFDGTDEYVVDSRDWFVDMVTLLEGGYLGRLPKSASPDNHPEGRGSYSWYIDEDGNVRSLQYEAPIAATSDFQGAYP